MPENTFVPCPDTAREYRIALGSFGTGVTVVTAMGPRGPMAFTANSFTSVSMDPPLLLWCPAKLSQRHDAFVAAKRFAIHVMAEDQLDMAIHFATDAEDFSRFDWQADALGTPLLSGCISRFDCVHHAHHDAGDHTIILGQVHQVVARPGKGLLFKRGQFGGFLEQS